MLEILLKLRFFFKQAVNNYLLSVQTFFNRSSTE